MIYAKHNEELVKAFPKLHGNCPYCNGGVISKCGDINIWHWAHIIKSNSCIYKEMSEWHIEHQLKAESAGWELEKHIGNRIADCVFKNNIIELQKSSISDQEILMRNINYGAYKKNVHWVFDYRSKMDDMILTHNDDIIKFKQNWSKKSIIILFNYIENKHKSIWGNVYFNVSDDKYIHVKKLYDNGNGWGKYVNYETILNECGKAPNRIIKKSRLFDF